MNHLPATAMNPASAVATTGSDAAQPYNRDRYARGTALIKDSDLTPRMRLMVQYMVHGPDHQSLADRVLRPHPILDKDGLQVGEERKPVPIGTPLTLEEAALLCNKRRRWARNLAQQPAWQRLLQRETIAFREGAKARAWRKIDELAHKPGDGSAAWAKVNHQAATTITGEPRQGGTTVNVQTNVGVSAKAGLVLRLPADAPQIPLEAEDSSK